MKKKNGFCCTKWNKKQKVQSKGILLFGNCIWDAFGSKWVTARLNTIITTSNTLNIKEQEDYLNLFYKMNEEVKNV